MKKPYILIHFLILSMPPSCLTSLTLIMTAGLKTNYCSLAHLYIDPNICLLLYTGL